MKWYPKLLQNIILPMAEKILGQRYMSELRHWRQIENQSPEAVLLIQDKQLKKLLHHAINTVPAYHSLPSNSTLNDFPIATKAMYRKDENCWISNQFHKEDLIAEKSSGSSGIQGKVYMSRSESMLTLAHQTYLWTWAGYVPGEHLLQLGMTMKRGWFKYVKDQLFCTTYTQAFDLNHKAVAKVLSSFRGKRSNVFFGGYASGLYEYARIAQLLGINDVHFTSVISWGDKMFNHYRELIESQFKSRVFDTYGTTEGFVIAGQCEQASYHLLTPHIYLELLDDQGKEVAVGELGHVVITRLDAYSMPLIRYRLGDLAIKDDPEKKCTCGRPFPMLKKIIGRDTDLVRSPAGKALIVHFFTGIFEHIAEIRQFQVYQKDLTGFTVRYISEISEEMIIPILSSLHEVMNKKAGEILIIDFVRVNRISPSSSGKPEIIVSDLKKTNLI